MDDGSPTLKQALKSAKRELWIQAISEELESLNQAQTWDVVPYPSARVRVLPSKFVLKVKRNSDGTIERYKTWLVLLRHLQRPEIDYFETYAPVAVFTAVRIALVTACQLDMAKHHLDVKCAFLNGVVDEEIFMRLPDEYNSLSDAQVC
jgi:hypothetical protein